MAETSRVADTDTGAGLMAGPIKLFSTRSGQTSHWGGEAAKDKGVVDGSSPHYIRSAAAVTVGCLAAAQATGGRAPQRTAPQCRAA